MERGTLNENRCNGLIYEHLLALVLAALVADGETNIHRIYHFRWG